VTERNLEPSRYAVDDDSCTACGLCHERAPENIEMDEDEMIARVVRQPATSREEAACHEAAAYCPTGGLAKAESEPPTD